MIMSMLGWVRFRRLGRLQLKPFSGGRDAFIAYWEQPTRAPTGVDMRKGQRIARL